MPTHPLPGATNDKNSFVYWDLQQPDGNWFPLHTYAWSVKSFGGRRFFGAPKRGEDIAVPFRRGRLFVPKTREAQTYDINMWVFPTNQDGSRDVTKTVEQKAHENWRKIINAVDQEGQFRLRKRWYDEASTVSDFEVGGHVSSAIAMAEFLDGSGPGSDDGKDFYLDLTFTLADPYFYGKQILGSYTAAAKAAEAITLTNNGTTSIPLTGDAPSTHVYLEITLSGSYTSASQNPIISFPDGHYIEFNAFGMSSPSGTYVIDCHNGIAAQSTLTNYFSNGTISNYVSGLINRSPRFLSWPVISGDAAASTANITTTGQGTIKLIYDPAFR